MKDINHLLVRAKKRLQKYYSQAKSKSYRNALMVAMLEIENIESETEKLTKP